MDLWPSKPLFPSQITDELARDILRTPLWFDLLPPRKVELRRTPEICRDEGHDYDDDYWMEDEDTVALYCSRCHWDHKFRRVEL